MFSAAFQKLSVFTGGSGSHHSTATPHLGLLRRPPALSPAAACSCRGTPGVPASPGRLPPAAGGPARFYTPQVLAKEPLEEKP